jgi:hypothetical protein
MSCSSLDRGSILGRPSVHHSTGYGLSIMLSSESRDLSVKHELAFCIFASSTSVRPCLNETGIVHIRYLVLRRQKKVELTVLGIAVVSRSALRTLPEPLNCDWGPVFCRPLPSEPYFHTRDTDLTGRGRRCVQLCTPFFDLRATALDEGVLSHDSGGKRYVYIHCHPRRARQQEGYVCSTSFQQ